MEEVIKKEDNVSRTLESLFQSNKINNFLYPQSSSSSSSTNLSQLKFNSPTSSLSLSHEHLGLSSFTTPRQQVTMTQIYPSRKIKHSFRKRASSGSAMPYYIPFRHRQRTKSESQDNQTVDHHQQLLSMECENSNPQMEMDGELNNLTNPVNNNNPQFNKIKLVQLKKSKSLESLSSTKDVKEGSSKEQSFSTMEFFDLNHRIQKLNLVHD